MRKRTKRVCQVCGKPFFGSKDCYYCPECARDKKIDSVVKKRICQDCGVEFYGGPRARRCPDCAYKAKQETLGDAGDGGQSARLGVLINVSGAERNIRLLVDVKNIALKSASVKPV